MGLVKNKRMRERERKNGQKEKREQLFYILKMFFKRNKYNEKG
jgi:hypothetical protein